jgi:microcompartment protein CcmL/EutN
MNEKSIGVLELSSVAAGFLATDSMLKAGDVTLCLARSICAGKYMVVIAGSASAVESAMAAGVHASNGCLIDSFVVAQIHPDVLTAMGRTSVAPTEGALGILEGFNVATVLRAADVVAKAASVQLLEVRLAMALGGKAFLSITGDVASVLAAVAAGRAVLAEAGMLVNAVVIPRPHPAVYRECV